MNEGCITKKKKLTRNHILISTMICQQLEGKQKYALGEKEMINKIVDSHNRKILTPVCMCTVQNLQDFHRPKTCCCTNDPIYTAWLPLRLLSTIYTGSFHIFKHSKSSLVVLLAVTFVCLSGVDLLHQ